LGYAALICPTPRHLTKAAGGEPLTMRSAYHQPAFGGDSLGCSDRAACSIVTVYLERMIYTFTKFRMQAPISAIFSAIHFRDLLPLLGRDGDLASGCVPSFGVLLF